MPDLSLSMFEDVFFPPHVYKDGAIDTTPFVLKQPVCFNMHDMAPLKSITFVVFDFETTGLNAKHDHIVELGAIRMDSSETKEFSTLIDPSVTISKHITSISGITQKMLIGQPKAADVIPKFLSFIEGSVLVAHNADFDMKFLRINCERIGLDLRWPAVCTLKMARALLPNLKRKNLDTLASHYGLTFESRHRSIGDVKVTCDVFSNLLSHLGKSENVVWKDLKPFIS